VVRCKTRVEDDQMVRWRKHGGNYVDRCVRFVLFLFSWDRLLVHNPGWARTLSPPVPASGIQAVHHWAPSGESFLTFRGAQGSNSLEKVGRTI
jgi:hypothetical protein